MEINEEARSNFKKNLLEECFILVYKTSMTLEDAFNLPVSYRKWFVNRIIQQIEAEQPKESSAPHPPIPKF